MKKPGVYDALIAEIFRRHYKKRKKGFTFNREEIPEVALDLGIKRPKNVGDVLYTYRYRRPLPAAIIDTEPLNFQWNIFPAGQAKYKFELRRKVEIIPNSNLSIIKIPDATPEIIATHALNDEQALLTKIRYNRLIDIFLGITAYSLQNHLRTNVKDIGQLEIDEIYIGVNKNGAQFIIPVQAKGGSDKLGVVQTRQDIYCCRHKFPNLNCRPISTQFMEDNRIAIFELAMDKNEEVSIADERHYKLVKSSNISDKELEEYSFR